MTTTLAAATELLARSSTLTSVGWIGYWPASNGGALAKCPNTSDMRFASNATSLHGI